MTTPPDMCSPRPPGPSPRARSRAFVGIAAGMCLLTIGAWTPKSPVASADPSDLIGEWRVDLRPTPDSEPYYVEFTITSADENGITGTFYDSAIEASAINDDWGNVRFAIVTVDGASRYVTNGVLEGETMSGTTYSPDRDVFSVWTAERR